MNKISIRISVMLAAILALAFTSCEKSRSYAELLQTENMAVNRFLADQKVVAEIPADSVFEVGPDAPYYQIDPEGNVYMQVLAFDPDSPDIESDQVVYFRFMRYNLSLYTGSISALSGEGNEDDLTKSATSFRYQNFTLPSSSEWGSGIQLPLTYLKKLNCELNLVVKSQYGWQSEISYVQPFLIHVRYYPAAI
ncbi:MAG: DUF4827 domain-containing protein [Muribaculaceae bacterium]|nr:DUF4827 domain-containing protein [Muribaculaceae bacterium]